MKKSAAAWTVDSVLKRLHSMGSQKIVDGMGRFGIPSKGAIGIAMGDLQKFAKEIGVDHALAQALWKTGCYEARMISAYVGDPAQVTLREMSAWAAAFDSWAVCDTVCFKLWDRSPLAWKAAVKWVDAKPEFTRRTSFVLMACLALHDKAAPDKDFLPFLPLLEKGAGDERNFVKKAVSWGLRGIGKRNPKLRTAVTAVAKRLAVSDEASARWVGKDVLRELKARG